MSGGADYKPLPPERLYLKPSQWDKLLEGHSAGQFTSFDSPPRHPMPSTSGAVATKASPRPALRRA